MVITYVILMCLFIERDDFIKIELVPPVRLKHIGVQRATGKSLHDIVWRIANTPLTRAMAILPNFMSISFPPSWGVPKKARPKLFLIRMRQNHTGRQTYVDSRMAVKRRLL